MYCHASLEGFKESYVNLQQSVSAIQRYSPFHTNKQANIQVRVGIKTPDVHTWCAMYCIKRSLYRSKDCIQQQQQSLHSCFCCCLELKQLHIPPCMSSDPSHPINDSRCPFIQGMQAIMYVFWETLKRGC